MQKLKNKVIVSGLRSYCLCLIDLLEICIPNQKKSVPFQRKIITFHERGPGLSARCEISVVAPHYYFQSMITEG